MSKQRAASYIKSAIAVTATAVAGSVATDPSTAWYKKLDKPSWQPPSWAFPVAWTALYASIALASGKVLADAKEDDDVVQRGQYKRALALNLALNAGWSYTFFKAQKLGPAAIVAAALAASSSDLAKRAGRSNRKLGWLLTPYAMWTSFATALSTEIWKRNRD
ncbi:MAG: tryptophan-rich sensory protein [Propionibacterium sp.]|nr:tryptophan-rich sensory protein [Propionibacterium sp.]